MKGYIATHLFVIIVWSFLGPTPAWTDTIWAGDISPSDPANWTSTTVGYIGNTTEGTIAVDAGSELLSREGYLGFSSQTAGEVTVSGIGSQWKNNYILTIGHKGEGALNVQAGGAVSSTHVYLGTATGSIGEATITGAGSQLSNNGGLYVGLQGRGTLNVEAGGTAMSYFSYLGQVADSSGEATVSGNGSRWTIGRELRVGDSGKGKLNIVAGGTVEASNGSSGSVLGYDPGSTGEATVNGAGSQWSNLASLTVGGKGAGALNIEDGGIVSNHYGLIGQFPGSMGEATVTGAGSRWINSYQLMIGREGSGTLRVENGGHVSAVTLYASLKDLHGDGTITASGAVLDGDLMFNATHKTQNVLTFGSGGALTVAVDGGELGVGYKGAGSLFISEGAVINSRYGYMGYNAGSSGEATVEGVGSQWNTDFAIEVGRGGAGKLNIQAGGTVNSGFGYVTSKGEATVTGAGSRWINRGGLSFDYYGGGSLTISDGGLVAIASVLSLSGRYVHGESLINLSTGGMLALASNETGDDSLSNFLSRVEGRGSIQYWDSDLAGWADITTATVGDDYTLEYQTTGDLAGYTLLTVGQLPSLTGDYNSDGTVDSLDYEVWAQAYGQQGNGLAADGNFDGVVDAADYTVWRESSTANGATNASVPEPMGMLLALVGAIASASSARFR